MHKPHWHRGLCRCCNAVKMCVMLQELAAAQQSAARAAKVAESRVNEAGPAPPANLQDALARLAGLSPFGNALMNPVLKEQMQASLVLYRLKRPCQLHFCFFTSNTLHIRVWS